MWSHNAWGLRTQNFSGYTNGAHITGPVTSFMKQLFYFELILFNKPRERSKNNKSWSQYDYHEQSSTAYRNPSKTRATSIILDLLNFCKSIPQSQSIFPSQQTPNYLPIFISYLMGFVLQNRFETALKLSLD